MPTCLLKRLCHNKCAGCAMRNRAHHMQTGTAQFAWAAAGSSSSEDQNCSSVFSGNCSACINTNRIAGGRKSETRGSCAEIVTEAARKIEPGDSDGRECEVPQEGMRRHGGPHQDQQKRRAFRAMPEVRKDGVDWQGRRNKQARRNKQTRKQTNRRGRQAAKKRRPALPCPRPSKCRA